jgi:hypothetical protein
MSISFFVYVHHAPMLYQRISPFLDYQKYNLQDAQMVYILFSLN